MQDIKISDAFANGKAFIPFITCGDPDIETTEKIVMAMQDAGADLIELGIPFSDPTAEGPVIQDADLRALEAGTTTDAVMDMVGRLRENGLTVPVVFMTYANVVFSYGSERFCERAAEVGVQGLIIPDCPYEEHAEFENACKAAGLAQISMIAPTSEDRVREIASNAEGFLYCVSSLGVTGMRDSITTNIDDMIAAVRKYSDIPCAVGFGISRPDQATEMAAKSDGAIVGSAIVKLCAEHGRDAIEPIREYVTEMCDAVALAND